VKKGALSSEKPPFLETSAGVMNNNLPNGGSFLAAGKTGGIAPFTFYVWHDEMILAPQYLLKCHRLCGESLIFTEIRSFFLKNTHFFLDKFFLWYKL
jgi:hypothetical protein